MEYGASQADWRSQTREAGPPAGVEAHQGPGFATTLRVRYQICGALHRPHEFEYRPLIEDDKRDD